MIKLTRDVALFAALSVIALLVTASQKFSRQAP